MKKHQENKKDESSNTEGTGEGKIDDCIKESNNDKPGQRKIEGDAGTAVIS